MYDKSSVSGNDSLRPRSARAERPEFSRTVSADTATYKGLPRESDGKTLKTQTLYLEVTMEETERSLHSSKGERSREMKSQG